MRGQKIRLPLTFGQQTVRRRETAYLLRSPRNAVRLLAALTRARRGGTKAIDLTTLRRELGLEGS